MAQDCKKMGFDSLPDHRTAYYLLENGDYLGVGSIQEKCLEHLCVYSAPHF